MFTKPNVLHMQCKMVEMLHQCCCRFPIKEQVALLQQVASALAQLHSKGIVHQDLHSDNILQSLDGLQYKVSDLGNAEFCQVDGQPNEIFHSK